MLDHGCFTGFSVDIKVDASILGVSLVIETGTPIYRLNYSVGSWLGPTLAIAIVFCFCKGFVSSVGILGLDSWVAIVFIKENIITY